MFDAFGIAGNRQAFEDLVTLLKTGKAIGFVGAGASAPLYPLWGGLIEKLIEQATSAEPTLCDFWRKEAAKRPVAIAKQIRSRSDAGSFHAAIRRIFGPRDGGRFTDTHRALLQLPFAAFATTNYDPGLELACGKLRHDRRAVPFTWRDDRTSLWGEGSSEELPILHAHGRYDESKTIVLDIDDYRAVYGHAAPYPSLLEHLVVRESLVFVGFSFEDLWLTSFADRVLTHSGKREVAGPLHFAILPLAEDERENARFHAEHLLESVRARTLFYPVRGGDHGALGVLLQALIDATASSSVSGAPSAPKAPAGHDRLDLYFEHLSAAHRRLAQGFDRPGRLDLIEEAWVEVEVATDAPGRFADSGKEWLGRSIPLARALELEKGDAAWITGRWLLEGPPGSGKTTLLRRLAGTLAQARRRERIPVFLPLPKLALQPASWLEVATEGFAAVGAGSIVAELEAAGREGRLLILLDGLDEVPPARRDGIATLLHLLGRQCSGCQVLLSSRPLGRGEPPDGFPRLALQPLPVEQQRRFLAKWLSEAGRNAAEAAASAERALAAFADVRGLGELAGIPLYLTLVAEIWQHGEALPERMAGIYDRVFDFLLSGKHQRDPKVIQSPADVREALAFLAHGMTTEDLWAESQAELERRLRGPQLATLRARLETVSAWKDDLDAFLRDVYERTQILGPHDGRDMDWRFWHRTFREALAAERLFALYRHGGQAALLAWAQELEAHGEGQWAEPLALLAGRLPEPDALVRALAEVKPGLALRAMVFAEGLAVDTLVHTLGLTEDLGERAKVFAAIPDQLPDPLARLALVEQLLAGRPDGFDLFWLGHILDQVAERWPGHAPASRRLAERLFAHLPKPDPALFETVTTRHDGNVPLWRPIPAGQGWVGSPEHEDGRSSYEGPRHRVTLLPDFALAAVPVTNAQYAAFDLARADLTRPNHPVVNITWYEAKAFCRWLGTLPGFEGARLPTEEEWEYACRAGSSTRFWKGNAEQDLAAVGWYANNSGGQVHAAGEKAANPWGLYDVHGNVWEWTISAWKPDYSGQAGGLAVDSATPAADLAGPPSPAVRRVARGGSFRYSAHWARSAFRLHWDPGLRWDARGFRVALPRPPARRSIVDL